MSKAIRWQLFFAESKPEAQNPKHYRVDIYDEQDGSWSGVTQLLGGTSPFVTDEDDSDDYFAPIRTQTGTLQVCTLLPGTTDQYITLDELLPANNIARPVRLINTDNSDAIEWQGFLSCEAYSQDYTGVPQVLDFPIIGVLEAMDSVFMSGSSGLIAINAIIYTALNNIEISSGMNLWGSIYYSATAYRIFEKSINDCSLYNEDEIQDQHSLTYTLQGISCKDVIERLCKYMGWTAREKGSSIYFESIGEPLGMYSDTLGGFRYNFHTNARFIGLTTNDLSDSKWMGTGHQRSVMQGAKLVEVVAKLEQDDLNLELPDFPFDDPSGTFGVGTIGPYDNVLQTLYPWVVAEQNDAYYNICTYHYGYGTIESISTPSYDWRTTGYTEATKAYFLNNVYLKTGNITGSTKYAGAALVQFSITNKPWGGFRQNNRGLYCTILPNLMEAYPQPIFTLKSTKKYLTQTSGILKVTAKCYFIGYDRANNRAIITEDIQDEYLNIQYARIAPVIRFGDKYYENNAWHDWNGYSSAAGEYAEFVKGGFELQIPISSGMYGDVEIGLLPGYSIDNRDTNTLFEVIFTELKVDFEYSDSVLWKDSSENRYISLLSTNFRDEVNVDVDFASSNNNRPSMSHIYDPGHGILKTLDYSTSSQDPTQVEARRPEVDLLNRLASYYGAARQRLELEVAHPTDAPLPLLKLNGINDGKVYLPLSESRDWQTDVCKLTCFETPE